MALNKYMHPRNIYKTPPDFAKLANSYEEFSSVAKKDATGKVSIDFKDPLSLRVLTRCLLKADFNLDVVIPEDRLVPTLPLRLNYILWIEDLLASVNMCENVQGLDIGTGACAIYPLLAAVKNKWHMTSTESDELSLQRALENVERNNLQGNINLKKNPSKSIMEHLFEENTELNFHFSMCNPPFYSNVQELCESRSPARLPPKNAFTGSPQELITEGGELEFCRKMIEESKKYENRVLIFTTMVGHKYTLLELAQDLQAEGVKYTSTEFCQGRVTRWGLAWTYQDYDIGKLVPARNKLRKKNVAIVFLLPEIPGIPYDVESISKKVKNIFSDLKIEFKILNKKVNCLTLDMKATTNTWSNQRRKRRLMKKIEEDTCKRQKLNGNGSLEEESMSQELQDNKELPNMTTKAENNTSVSSEEHNVSSSSIDTMFEECVKSEAKGLPENRLEKSKNNEASPLVHCITSILRKANNIFLEMEFLDGTAGKEGVHQIIQYIKNNWKYTSVFYTYHIFTSSIPNVRHRRTQWGARGSGRSPQSVAAAPGPSPLNF